MEFIKDLHYSKTG